MKIIPVKNRCPQISFGCDTEQGVGWGGYLTDKIH